MRVARRYLIDGRVQGVGFRFFAYTLGGREGLDGWVRNLPDGRVEALAEGDVDAVARFERGIREGPRGARVDQVEVSEVTPSAGGAGFNIR